jgi:hypothetical protein
MVNSGKKSPFIPKLKGHMLTPKIGTEKRLTCGPSLVKEHHSAKDFPQSIL